MFSFGKQQPTPQNTSFFPTSTPNVNTNPTFTSNTGGSFTFPVQQQQQSFQPQPQVQAAPMNTPPSDPSYMELFSLHESFDPSSPQYPFRHFFYNVVNASDVAKYGKPLNVDEKSWNDAIKNNPNPTLMVPVLAVGFDDLHKRVKQQDRQSEIYHQKLKELEKKINELLQKQQVTLDVKVKQIENRQFQLYTSLLRLMKRLEVIRLHNHGLTPEEEELQGKFESCAQAFKKLGGTSLDVGNRLNEVKSRLSVLRLTPLPPSPADKVENSEVLNQLYQSLSIMNNAIKTVTTAIEKDLTETSQ